MDISPLQRKVHASELPLEKLAANKHVPEQEKVAEVARQFEAVLLRQILGNAQKTHFNSKFADNSAAGSIYKDLVTNQLADGISKSGGLGLGKVLATQMSHVGAKKNLPPAATEPSPLEPTSVRWLHAPPSKGAHQLRRPNEP